MIQKYKFMSPINLPSDKEIESYKDFDRLLALHKNAAKQWKLKAALYVSTVAIAVATLGYLYLQKHNTATKNSNKESIQIKTLINSKKESLERSKVDSSAFHIKDAVASAQHQKKTTSLRDKTPIGTKNKPAEEVESAVQSGFEEAQPVGGYPALFEFFKQNIQYPEQSKKDKIEGSVLVEFYVSEQGRALDITIVKGVNKEIDLEATRLIATMPKWQPALVAGTSVSMKVTLPLTFQIQPTSK